MRAFRKHSSWYTKCFPGSAPLRQRLMQVSGLAELAEVLAVVDRCAAVPARGDARAARQDRRHAEGRASRGLPRPPRRRRGAGRRGRGRRLGRLSPLSPAWRAASGRTRRSGQPSTSHCSAASTRRSAAAARVPRRAVRAPRSSIASARKYASASLSGASDEALAQEGDALLARDPAGEQGDAGRLAVEAAEQHVGPGLSDSGVDRHGGLREVADALGASLPGARAGDGRRPTGPTTRPPRGTPRLSERRREPRSTCTRALCRPVFASMTRQRPPRRSAGGLSSSMRISSRRAHRGPAEAGPEVAGPRRRRRASKECGSSARARWYSTMTPSVEGQRGAAAAPSARRA